MSGKIEIANPIRLAILPTMEKIRSNKGVLAVLSVGLVFELAPVVIGAELDPVMTPAEPLAVI